MPPLGAVQPPAQSPERAESPPATVEPRSPPCSMRPEPVFPAPPESEIPEPPKRGYDMPLCPATEEVWLQAWLWPQIKSKEVLGYKAVCHCAGRSPGRETSKKRKKQETVPKRYWPKPGEQPVLQRAIREETCNRMNTGAYARTLQLQEERSPVERLSEPCSRRSVAMASA
ncbi:hypothetical protein NDU88_003171 [Pleurodeles waltl]|uniref:Uncharacterized protein n=1 Tax=Pleurodeles waltl TaxID=8319 RepID=A0AAV7NHG9_PLEWA|nr:hypothetical protein NDU88_003171 [Pleurodeles waltl]